MTKYMYKLTAMTMAVILSITAAKADDLTRKVNKSFEVSQGDKLMIDTKFGDVNIIETKDNKVTFEVTISVDESSNRAKQLFEEIEVKLEKDGNTVKGITELPSMKKTKGIQIDYEISAPSYLEFELEHKFGDAYIEHFDGKCDIEMKFGNFKADILSNKHNEIEFQYIDNAIIGVLTDVRLEIQYSELSLKKGSFLTVRSSYSEIEIEELHSLVLEAKYDEYDIGNIENLNIDAKYTDFDIEKATRKIIYEGSFGSLVVDEVPAGFEEINIDVQYNSCKIGIDEAASYNLEGDAKFGSIHFDNDNFKGETDKGMNSYDVKGKINGGGKAKVIIDSSFGDIRL